MFLVPCLKENNLHENKLWEVVERKISVLSSSSIDSGISVQREDKKDKLDAYSIRSFSSSSSVSIDVNESPALSDYESDEDNSQNISQDFLKDDMNDIFNENQTDFSAKDLQLILHGSKFEFHFSKDEFLLANRETAV